MKAIGQPILGLMMLAGLTAGAPLCAEDAPKSCDVPAYLLTSDSPLPKVAAAVKAGGPLNVLVVGSRSSTIAGAGDDAYPARLQAALAELVPGVAVKVTTDVSSRRTADQMVKTLPPALAAAKPALMIWQTGTVDAMQSIDIDQFKAALDRGISIARSAGADVVLINA